ncbi:MAG TPA: hypothetical protein VFX98_11960 [Longimicrobiaceae bacterium]|nr:hypothetical protein [Longimicrobiaceae bacterium]
MQKIRLDLEALEVESFAVADAAAEVLEAGPTRRCLTPDCTAGPDCI